MQEEWSLQPGTTTLGLSVLPNRAPADRERSGNKKKRNRLRKFIICDFRHSRLTLFETLSLSLRLWSGIFARWMRRITAGLWLAKNAARKMRGLRDVVAEDVEIGKRSRSGGSLGGAVAVANLFRKFSSTVCFRATIATKILGCPQRVFA